MLFTFPSRYWSTIGLQGVFSLAGWARRIHAGLLVSRATQDSATLRHATCTQLSCSMAALSRAFHSRASCDGAVLQPRRRRNADGLGSSPVARHYWGNHSCFLFLRVLRCFSSPRWPPASGGMSCLQHDGLSHSEIRGSRAMCASPRLFAACHVLHRLREPRHPPCALSYFWRRTAPCRAAGIYFRLSSCKQRLHLRSFLVSLLLVTSCHRTSLTVENNGFEPLTPCLQSRCSSQLS